MGVNQKYNTQKGVKYFFRMNLDTDRVTTYIENIYYYASSKEKGNGNIELKENNLIIHLIDYRPINISFNSKDEIDLTLNLKGGPRDIECEVLLFVNNIRQKYSIFMSLKNAFNFKTHFLRCLNIKSDFFDLYESNSINIDRPNKSLYDPEWDITLYNAKDKLVTVIGEVFTYGFNTYSVYIALVDELCMVILENGIMEKIVFNFDEDYEIKVTHREGYDRVIESKVELYKNDYKEDFWFYMESSKAILFKKHFELVYSNERQRRFLIKERQQEINRNKEIEKEIKLINFKNEVSIRVKELSSNSDISRILLNYFNTYLKDNTLLKIKSFIEVEKYLFESNNFGILCLKSEEDILKSYEAKCPEHFILMNNFLNTKGYIKNSEKSLFITWELINKFAISYYSKIWDEKYSGYINNLDSLSLKECVKSYYNIDIIDHDEEKNRMLFINFLINSGKFHDLMDDDNQLKAFDLFDRFSLEVKDEAIKEKRIVDFENNIHGFSEYKAFSIKDTDDMNGIEFENFLKTIFENMGYKVRLTQISGDQGIDLVIMKNSTRIGVQAKCYRGSVSNSAVQQVVAGLNFYNCVNGLVVTNSYFTKSAIELAKANNIILWDRNKLEQVINDIV